MCVCNLNIKTPFCGKIGCQWPKQQTNENRTLEEWIIVMLIGNTLRVFRMQNQMPDLRTINLAALILPASEIGEVGPLKDQFGIFNPNTITTVTNKEIHEMFTSNIVGEEF